MKVEKKQTGFNRTKKRAITKNILQELEKNHTRQVYQKNNSIKGGYKKYEHLKKKL